MAAQDPPIAAADPDEVLRAAFQRMRGPYPQSFDKEAFAWVRSQCPALTAAGRYRQHDHVASFGSLDHMHVVVEADDLPALRELIRLEPDLLTFEVPGDFLCPLLVLAARLGRNALLDVLLQHRDALPPERRAPPPPPTEDDEDDEGDEDDERGNWGTPLAEACAQGHLDTVRLLLQRMPDADINEVGPNGLTPFLAAAAGRQQDDVPAETRVELIRLLRARGADVHAVQQAREPVEQEDEHGRRRRRRRCWRLRPGGRGNALALALEAPATAPAVVAALLEAGVDVGQCRYGTLPAVDRPAEGEEAAGRTARAARSRCDHAYFSPLAVGAQCHNVAGLRALLDLLPDDHARRRLLLASADAVVVPQPRARDPGGGGDDEVPVLLPLHAAVLGGGPYARRGGQPWTADDARAAADTVRLLTADPAVCAATLRAPYRRGRHHLAPLHLATSFDRLPLLLALVERGAAAAADLEAPPPPRRDGHGLVLALFASVARIAHTAWLRFTPGWAVGLDAATDMQAVLEALLAGGPSADDAAADADRDRRLRLLNEADADGNTPLHFAMAYRLSRSAAALVALGADPHAANRAGQRPHTPPPGQQPSI